MVRGTQELGDVSLLLNTSKRLLCLFTHKAPESSEGHGGQSGNHQERVDRTGQQTLVLLHGNLGNVGKTLSGSTHVFWEFKMYQNVFARSYSPCLREWLAFPVAYLKVARQPKMAPRRMGCSSGTQDQCSSRIYLEINHLFKSVQCLKLMMIMLL